MGVNPSPENSNWAHRSVRSPYMGVNLARIATGKRVVTVRSPYMGVNLP